MRLVSYGEGFGRIDGDYVVHMGREMARYFKTGEADQNGRRMPLESVRLLPPIPMPSKIIGIGFNYADHIRETRDQIPVEPVLFAKYANSLIGPNDSIVVPPATRQPDYEAELAVVIGQTAHRVSVDEAADRIAGYACANDVSARDLQLRTSQWTRGKAIDTFLPLGPWLVTADEIPDPQNLRIRCLVNGEVLQDSSTSKMIWSVFELVSFISETMTLDPGDIICTGTPPGVGVAREPKRFLRAGDVVTVEIESIGALTNPVIDDDISEPRI